MTETKSPTHTPGRLTVDHAFLLTELPPGEFPAIVVAHATSDHLSIDQCNANARRLAACWNACEGISTEALESGVVAELVELLTIFRDHLEKHATLGLNDEEVRMLQRADAALARVAGKEVT